MVTTVFSFKVGNLELLCLVLDFSGKPELGKSAVHNKGGFFMYADKTLTCRECQREYVFTAGEQAFYAEEGFEIEPARCPSCRTARKQRQHGSRGERQMYNVICSECGMETEVTFNPSPDRPVYCRDCYQKQKSF